ncbi:type II toxin-antitoxin system RelE/ParE family toxin [Halomicronema sp. CCY15110]|uniref:type II toxin-antitoxin system RelE/ParE family toxin n=1 Tax=Halomicronema sp. CCY15110 TaxID=2767773 RepID=UPI00194FE64A|nr:type II toxin-antitoxin system RelE/ParE family toxin [Halomicronema sp. CCY15110]
MTRSCRITPEASQDIEAIADYLATHSSLTRAEDFLSGIDAALQRIAQFPEIGRKRDELYPGLRSVPYKQYLIFYRLLNDAIEIFRVVSGYQDLPALFEEDPE